MKRDIFGQIYIESKDYCDLLLKEIENQEHISIFVKQHTDHGFETNINWVDCPGIYLIYKDNKIVYIGCTSRSIRMRIGRFLAGVRGTEHWNENHSAAYKYVDIFGRDLSGLTFKYSKLEKTDLFPGIEINDIENHVIEIMKPLFNDETYYDYEFEKKVIIKSKDGEYDARLI